METAVHLFLFNGGAMLPRWKEAFPSIKGAASEAARTVDGAAGVALVWLRLKADVPVHSQILGVPAHLKSISLVVLSDDPSDEEALAALSAGARGFCNSHAAPLVLRQVSDTVLSGGLWVGESLMRRFAIALARIPKSREKTTETSLPPKPFGVSSAHD